MLNAFADLLPFVFGLVAAPLPVVAVILLLMAEGGRAKAVAFIAAWTATVFVVATAVSLLTGPGQADKDSASPAWVGVVQLLIGLLLLVLAGRTLRSSLRTARGGAPEPPGWLTSIDGLTPVKVMGLSAALSGLNPKNLAMILGAGAAVGAFGLGVGGSAAAALVFAVLGSLGLLVPLAFVLLSGRAGARALASARSWLIAHNDTVTMTVLFVFGGVFLAKGLRALVR